MIGDEGFPYNVFARDLKALFHKCVHLGLLNYLLNLLVEDLRCFFILICISFRLFNPYLSLDVHLDL